MVFKNSAKTDTTIGKANNVSSYTRTYLTGQYVESREWPVLVMTIEFSRYIGRSVSNSYNRVAGIITSAFGGIDIINRTDMTYDTPISSSSKLGACSSQPCPRYEYQLASNMYHILLFYHYLLFLH